MADEYDPRQWLGQWQAMQQQFADAWGKAAAGGGFGAAPTPRAPINEGFDAWAKLFGQQAGGSETVDRVLAGARQYVQMMQAAVGQMGQAGAVDATAFGAAARDALGGVGGFAGANPLLDAFRQATGGGAKSFENLFADFAKQAGPLREQAMAALNLPAFGYSREQTERHQAMAKAWADYGDQLQRYNAVMLKASQRGLSRFESKLGEKSEPGREIKSLREFYDTWIDAMEEGFAEVALSPEYRTVYGELVNAQMRVRQLTQGEVERSTGALGMPTRGEVDASHRKLAELRRRVAQLEERLEAAGIVAADDDGASDGDVAANDAPAARAPRPARAAAARSTAARSTATRSTATRAKPPAPARAAAPTSSRAVAIADPTPPAGKPAKPGSFAQRLAAQKSGARKGSKR